MLQAAIIVLFLAIVAAIFGFGEVELSARSVAMVTAAVAVGGLVATAVMAAIRGR